MQNLMEESRTAAHAWTQQLIDAQTKGLEWQTQQWALARSQAEAGMDAAQRSAELSRTLGQDLGRAMLDALAPAAKADA
jgi:hypothetical protein